MRTFGEWEVRGDARADTRSHFRTGITSVVPSLLVSDPGSAIAPGGATALVLAAFGHVGSA